MKYEAVLLVQHQINLDGRAKRACFEIINDGAVTLTDCKLQGQDHPQGEFYDILSGSDYDTPTALLLFVSTNPSTLTAGSKSHVHLNLEALNAIRFTVTAGSGSPTITVRGSIFQKSFRE